MTLTDRVRAADQSHLQVSREQHERNKANFLRLRANVQELLSAEDISRMMRNNPQLARSEVRRACGLALADDSWLMVGSQERIDLTDEMIDSIFGFGPLEGMIADESITEIMVNGPQKIFYERDGRLYQSDQQFANEAQLRSLIDRILGPLGRRIDEASPMVNARLPQGHRVNAIIPPLALGGSVLTIRKFSERLITLDQMVLSGSVEATVATLLRWAVRMRKNIAVVGGTGSGKTTLLNALSCCISPGERIITIEDSAELRFTEHPHVVSLEARPRNAEGVGEVGIRDLVINALRMRPDRIIVGECRGAEALDMLQAMNTGHDGSMTTLHANSPADAVSRMTTMVRYGADLPVDAIEAYIAAAFDLVVQVSRDRRGQRVLSAVAEACFDEGNRRCVMKPMYRRRGSGGQEVRGEWLSLPSWLTAVSEQGVADGKEVSTWKSSLFFAA